MNKKLLLRLFFTAEILLFGWFYYYGVRGIVAVQELKAENNEIAVQVADLQNEIDAVDAQIIAWNSDPYFKEKIAREQLQMARDGDEIYVIG